MQSDGKEKSTSMHQKASGDPEFPEWVMVDETKLQVEPYVFTRLAGTLLVGVGSGLKAGLRLGPQNTGAKTIDSFTTKVVETVTPYTENMGWNLCEFVYHFFPNARALEQKGILKDYNSGILVTTALFLAPYILYKIGVNPLLTVPVIAALESMLGDRDEGVGIHVANLTSVASGLNKIPGNVEKVL